MHSGFRRSAGSTSKPPEKTLPPPSVAFPIRRFSHLAPRIPPGRPCRPPLRRRQPPNAKPRSNPTRNPPCPRKSRKIDATNPPCKYRTISYHYRHYRVGEKSNTRVPNDHDHHHQQSSRNGRSGSDAKRSIWRSPLGHPVGHSGPCYRHGEFEHKTRSGRRR